MGGEMEDLEHLTSHPQWVTSKLYTTATGVRSWYPSDGYNIKLHLNPNMCEWHINMSL